MTNTARRVAGGWVVLALGVAWIASIAAGMKILVDYSTTPGEGDDPAPSWPEQSHLAAPHGRPVLVMFAHPRCPCTRSSIGELAVIMARCHDAVTAEVLFLKPDRAQAAWWKTDLWDSAAAIPGVSVTADERGAEARLFGAATSGETLLYDGQGRLLFSGGITGARGHFGDNDGLDAVVALVRGQHPAPSHTFVFGCALRDPHVAAGGGGERWTR